MNEQMDDRMPDSQTDRQILRKQLIPLEPDTGQAAGQLGTCGFCTTAWRLSLPWGTLVLVVISSTAWTRPIYTKPSPASSRIHRMAGNLPGDLPVSVDIAVPCHAGTVQAPLQQSSSWLLTLQGAFTAGLS